MTPIQSPSKTRAVSRSLAGLLAALALPAMNVASAADAPPAAAPKADGGGMLSVEPDGLVHMPAMDVPYSSYASPQARAAYVRGIELARKLFKDPPKDIQASRKAVSDLLGVFLEQSLATYPVDIAPLQLGGVNTDVVTPKAGISPQNRSRVLINLHGGGFTTGAGVGALVEAVPIAAVGRIKVVTVDYRQGPEFKFPAASQDVAAVYRALLKHYKASNIGIYGCSAGGMLTTEAVAWLQKEGLPRPGAVGVFCASASGWAGGDSNYSVSSYGRRGEPEDSPKFAVSNVDYFSAADLNDPLVEPLRSRAVMAKFPPTLVITGTRDPSMSSAIHTHATLVDLGVDAELHVWEGMGHGFFYDSSTPEAKQAYAVIAKFFERHLGR